MSKINPVQAAALKETTKPAENNISPVKTSPVKTSPAKPTKTLAAKPAAKTAPAKPAVAKPAVAKPAGKLPTTPKAPAKKVEKVAVEKNAKVAKEKATKLKMERDSFTMPKAEYAQLYVLKERLIKLGQHSKKSELLRAGIMQLSSMTDAVLKAALAKVPAIKTGRPKKK